MDRLEIEPAWLCEARRAATGRQDDENGVRAERSDERREPELGDADGRGGSRRSARTLELADYRRTYRACVIGVQTDMQVRRGDRHQDRESDSANRRDEGAMAQTLRSASGENHRIVVCRDTHQRYPNVCRPAIRPKCCGASATFVGSCC